MERGPIGTKQSISSIDEECYAFIPNRLPPEPALELSPILQDKMLSASIELGRLDGLATQLPDVSVFIYSYVRKEAILSSQIEGTNSTLSDLLKFECDAAPGVVAEEDAKEASLYVKALNYGIDRINGGFPLCSRLMREMHQTLLAEGRGSRETPGEFRRSQNWIGGTRPGNAVYVPPPADRVHESMSDLDKFIHNQPVKTPGLIKAALAHVQFETIHPFLDGNGRIGRLLITLILCNEKILSQPLLYLSLYFKKNRSTYYDLLQQVRLTGDWELWLEFFFEGVEETAKNVVEASNKILRLFEADQRKIETLGRATKSAMELFRHIMNNPVMSTPKACEKLEMTLPTVNAAAENLVKLGILKEITGQKRYRAFAYEGYIDVLNKGTEL